MRPHAIAAVAVAAPAVALAGGNSPGFATLDRTGDATAAGAALTWLNVDALDEGGQRIELYGQWLADGGLGAYASLSAARATAAGDANTALGNLEIAAVWAAPRAPLRSIVRAGVALATAGDTVDDAFANLQAAQARITDAPATITGDVTWLRVAASPRAVRGRGTVRVDLGVDVPVAGDGRADANTWLRVNAAAGIDTGSVAAGIEWTNRIAVDRVDRGDDRLLHELALSVRYLRAGRLQPFVALALPLDGPGADLLNWAAIAGAEWTFARARAR
ncbi:MAG: hypothetical protein D6689_16265 [Deltaproteobacteria bacterium]|nr:MAG: hypothetical protein D6689_16265 [Deltaproteobacteria bacterium]